MNSKERMRMAFAHQEADRVPVGEFDIDEPVASKVLGREAWVGYGGGHRGKRFNEMVLAGRTDEYYSREAADLVDLTRKLELDWLHVLPHAREFTKPEVLGKNLWRYGDPGSDSWSVCTYQPDSDVYAEIDSGLLRGGIPAFERMVQNMESAAPGVEGLDFTQVDWIVKEIGSEIFLVGNVDIYLGFASAGSPVMMEAVALYPGLYERYLDAQLRHSFLFLQAQVQHGVSAVIGGEDWAGKSGPLISPRHYRTLVLPRLQKLVAECHRLGVPFIKHTDGNIMKVEQELLVESGIDAYQAIEPAAGMDIAEIKQRHGSRLTLMGNIDCARLLCEGTPEEVAEVTRQTIRDAAPGGGFVLTSSNSIHGGVRLENFMAMLETARRYGCYPIE
ncbi:MAG: uroporphyrinogen decarboxylase family protein [Omnitrophica WOR_2 bacterium]